ncbi:MAG: response regulator [Pseudomonadota bacterium]
MATQQTLAIDGLIPQRLFADPNLRHRARVLIFAIGAGALCSVICIGVGMALGVYLTGAQILVVLAPHILALPLLRISGNLELSCYAFLSGITVAIICLLSWDIFVAILGFVLLPMSAAHIAGYRAGVIWTFVCALLCMFWAPNFLPMTSEQMTMSYVSGILAITAGISSITVEQIRLRSVEALQTAQSSLAAERLQTRETLTGAFPVVIEVASGQCKYVAPNTASQLGYTEEQLLNTDFDELLHPNDIGKLHVRVGAAALDLAPLDIRLRHKEGHWAWLSAFVMINDQIAESEAYWTIAGHDVTDEKNEQAKLIQAQRLESIGVLAAGLAHDFNNMLTVIGGYADLLNDGEVKARISDTVDDAAILVQKLMAFGRNQPFVGEQAEITQVLDGMQAMLTPVLGPGVRLEIEHADREWWVGLSATQLNQIFLNLATNAKEAMGDKGQLRIALSEHQSHGEDDLDEGTYVRVAVTDTGAGMDTETLQYAFDPFFTTKEYKIGSGLGLSSVYGILKGAGGSASISSGPEQGATVMLFIPLQDVPNILEPETAPPVDRRNGRGSVLVVEDDQLIADLIARNLVAEGFNVTIKNDVTSAWEQLQKILPDLLVTDIMMPDGRGTELARRLRANTVDIPILFISGYSDQEISEWKNAEGEIRFLAKPFRRKELLSRVNELIAANRVVELEQ